MRSAASFLPISLRLLLTLVLAVAAVSPQPVANAQPQPATTRAQLALTALDRYVAAPDSNFTWKVVRELPAEGVSAVLLDMTSQQWLTEREVERPLWTHWITVVRPQAVTSDAALLFISGGSLDRQPPARPAAWLVDAARDTGSVTAELRLVPNQPVVFQEDPARKPRSEDDFIAYTWDKYLRTGDEKWPARLPMTKSAVRAMDAITAFVASPAGGGASVKRFVVSGASKRGWTTWTTAAVDSRVVAIAPAVIDMLNVEPSFIHHWRAYGAWSNAVKDYIDHRIMDWMGTKEFRALMKIEEPYEYRERLTMPKYMLNASGDQFFLPDSSQFYFKELRGDKYLRYVPNASHSLDKTDALENLQAFYATVVRNTPRPAITWTFEKDGSIKVVTKDRPDDVRVWQATNPEARNFRHDVIGSAYQSTVLRPSGPNTWVARVPVPPKGWTAFFVELSFPTGGKYPFKVTSGVRVLPETLPYPPPRFTAPTQRDASGSADARLRSLYTEEWNWRQKEVARSDQYGSAGANDRFPRVDAASQQARLAYWTKALTTLDSIPLDQLSPEERVNAQVFRASIRALANDVKFRTYEAPFNSDTFFWTEFTPRQGFGTVDAYRAYLGRLRDIPRYFEEQTVNMRAGLARGFTVPRVSVTGRDKTIEPYVKGDTSNPLYAPFSQMPSSISSADQAAMRADAATVIRDVAAPAFERLLAFMRAEYLPKARTTLGANTMPDGDAYYQAMIQKFTTLTLTAKQIHDIGLKEVARIEAEMEATKKRANFNGSMAEFFQFLRTDPQFYAKTPRELLSYSAYVSKKADWKLAETIGFLPRRRHGIRPVPDALAPIYTGGRGGLESCLMNTYNLPARPLYTLAALTLHECTPGHSFQAALALEGPERPAFRRGTSFSGYGEGWGLYTEWLGTVMGIYETPYEDFGRLTYEMWRACRLVIDTGIHQFGWTREQAVEYLRTRAALSEHEITTEVERYIAWPGQALAYKLGEIQIRRHRREAEATLGAKFDQRPFHDAILAIGSVPLPVLEQRMTQFVADGGR